DESQGVYVARQLSKNGLRVVAFDPMSAEMALNDIRRDIVVLGSIEECLAQADAVLITTPDPAFKVLKADDFNRDEKEIVVFDFWRLLRGELEDDARIKYIGIGIGEDDDATTAALEALWAGDARN
ncbi:MAG TPA: UDP-glucose/GDP-mannose dehydrogenase family protein, partial [Pyrinomonadaceae bacterium]|nr:UDP-glucose/GDP-mannose dehydrogenase family protein [Pyrinomonadaceae bacterium]